MKSLILIRGGGDLATGVAVRLFRSRLKLVVTELEQPLAVRRAVAFSEAIYEGECTVEGITAWRAQNPTEAKNFLAQNQIPVMTDPRAEILSALDFSVVIDARLLKKTPESLSYSVPLHIGLGPGFHAGENCHAVIETRRSHTLGRVYWNGTTQADSGQPEGDPRRVLRAPATGILISHANIADHLEEGQPIAEVNNAPVISPFKGVLRGLIHDGIQVNKGLKIGDIDPRDDASACFLVSDKSLAIGGGVLEAILSKPELHSKLWGT